MKRRRIVGVIAFFAACSATGCSEYTLIRSYPPGAKLYINDHFEGLTPVTFSVPRSDFADHDFLVRLERTGYGTVNETLAKRICPGRIVGGVFTLGIVFIFKGPTCFAYPQDFTLEATSGAPKSDSGDVGSGHQPTVQERLRRIENMRDQGTITNEEYQRFRQQILKDL